MKLKSIDKDTLETMQLDDIAYTSLEYLNSSKDLMTLLI